MNSSALLDKYLYIRKTPRWKVNGIYIFGLFSWLLVSYAYFFSFAVDPFFTFVLTPLTIFLTAYHLLSFSINLFYKQFDLKEHKRLVTSYFLRDEKPSVDVFLPICGEDFSILKKTWKSVSKLNYPNYTVFVLDDSPKDIALHKKLARTFGFHYLERPNKGAMKKAGNLQYGFRNSQGEYIAIFDADFAPHPDFLNETLPYMNDLSVGIVQTPQYFDSSERKNTLSYNASFAEEPFYRFIQVSRNRFNAAICCGSNALYRRSALASIGGPYQIEYSEDAHTGFEIISRGLRMLYIPVILAVGICPDNHYSFFHQQHRWCMGSMRLMLSRKFWIAPISIGAKLCYISGFLFYLHYPVMVLFSFHIFWVIFLYGDLIPGSVDYFYFPHLIFAGLYVFAFPISKVRPGYFLLLLERTFAYSHAVIVSLLRKRVGWISTNAKHSNISKTFTQSLAFSATYFLAYLLLTFLGFWTGDVKILDLRYWSVQFWIFYNLFLSFLVVATFGKTIISMARRRDTLFTVNKMRI